MHCKIQKISEKWKWLVTIEPSDSVTDKNRSPTILQWKIYAEDQKFGGVSSAGRKYCSQWRRAAGWSGALVRDPQFYKTESCQSPIARAANPLGSDLWMTETINEKGILLWSPRIVIFVRFKIQSKLAMTILILSREGCQLILVNVPISKEHIKATAVVKSIKLLCLPRKRLAARLADSAGTQIIWHSCDIIITFFISVSSAGWRRIAKKRFWTTRGSLSAKIVQIIMYNVTNQHRDHHETLINFGIRQNELALPDSRSEKSTVGSYIPKYQGGNIK